VSQLFIRSKDLYSRLGVKIACRARHGGWIKPLQSRPRYTIWSVEDVERVESRLACGDYPPLLACEIECEKRRAARAAAKKEVASAN
jgi:hypothetical protein